MLKLFKSTGLSLSVAIALMSTTPLKAFGFSDIREHWANQCIGQLTANQLVTGYPDNTFRPNRTVTRAEYAVLMLNLYPNTPIRQAAPTFRDVPANHWAARAIRQAAERGFFAGYPDGTFQPEQAIPRVQAIAVITNGLNPPAYQAAANILAQYFDDAAQIPEYARPAIAASLMKGTAINYPTVKQLRPNQSATRGEIAAMMCQARQLPGVPAAYVAGGQSAFAITPAGFGVGSFSEGLAAFRASSGMGFVNTSGTVAIAPTFFAVKPFAQGLAPAGIIPDADGTRWGYIDRAGRWVIEPRLEAAEPFAEGLAAVRVNGRVGFMNPQGNLVIPAQYDEALNFSEGLAGVRVGQQWGFINPQGEWVIPPRPWTITSFVGNRARVELNNQTGFIDSSGEWAIAPRYAAAQDFSEELAAAYDDASRRWGYIDLNGNWVIRPTFEAAQPFSEGLAGVRIQGKWGFIQPDGTVAIAPQFYPPQAVAPTGGPAEAYWGDVVRPFSQGLAMVRLGEQAGFIDRTGRFIIPPQFADADAFQEGFARVNAGGRWVPEALGGDSTGGVSGPYGTRFDGGGQWGYIQLPRR